MTDYKVIYCDELASENKEALVRGLNFHAFQQKKLGQNNGSIAFVIQDKEGKFLGGIQAYHYYGCCHVDLLWVDETLRNKGFGRKLMQKVEELARARHCLFMTVNTMDFEGRPFYERQGFSVEFIRSGFEKDSVMFFLRKEL